MRKLMACLVALVATAGAVNAAPLFSVTNTTSTSLANPPFTLGSQFQVSQSGTITALGIFDLGSNGLAEGHAVGLWTNSGTLLASTTIPAGTGGFLVDNFRYVSIPSVNLIAGQTYVLGALYPTGTDPVIFYGTATGFATAPGVTFLQSREVFGATLSFPTNSNSNQPGFFGPNALFAVPEPVSLVVFGGLIVGGAGVTLRRRMTAKA